jgi:hypothetical protein
MANTIPSAPPVPPSRASLDERVAILCAAIGYGPGDVELAKYIAGLEVRIGVLEDALYTRDTSANPPTRS